MGDVQLYANLGFLVPFCFILVPFCCWVTVDVTVALPPTGFIINCPPAVEGLAWCTEHILALLVSGFLLPCQWAL